MKRPLCLTVNGESVQLQVDARRTLLEVLREELKLFGARESCGVGMCGACTVLVDGRPLSACLTLAALHDGRSILTIEGLARGGALHPLQQSFIEHNAVQCGFCTPGMILMAKALLDEEPEAAPERVREFLAGNLCRCGGYDTILAAVLAARAAMAAPGRR
jgi:aerobic-type carbon monoxide dehydrogenase small subunit (CoxS/CutS family)